MNNNIKFLIMDVDGTLTDGKIYMGNADECCKAFDIKDGYGIHDILIPAGITPVIITGRQSKILENRCKELGITELYQGIENKIEKLNEFLAAVSQRNLNSGSSGMEYTYENCAYIGDDINDLSCMVLIKANGGLVSCPADAVKKVANIADFISVKNGGNGAVREFIDWICER